MGKLSLIGEMWLFLRENKKLWLLPMVLVFLVLGILFWATYGSAVAPFIYTIF